MFVQFNPCTQQFDPAVLLSYDWGGLSGLGAGPTALEVLRRAGKLPANFLASVQASSPGDIMQYGGWNIPNLEQKWQAWNASWTPTATPVDSPHSPMGPGSGMPRRVARRTARRFERRHGVSGLYGSGLYGLGGGLATTGLVVLGALVLAFAMPRRVIRRRARRA